MKNTIDKTKMDKDGQFRSLALELAYECSIPAFTHKHTRGFEVEKEEVDQVFDLAKANYQFLTNQDVTLTFKAMTVKPHEAHNKAVREVHSRYKYRP
jgi:hypothetical protein